MKLSIVTPTYNEKDNIEKLISLIVKEFELRNLDGEIIVVDDNSPDGTGEILEELKNRFKSLKVVHRSGKLGLSSAVLCGWGIAQGKVLGVIDADLSHPAEKIGDIYNAIMDGASLAIGSRYVKGGEIKGWGIHRKVMSKVATLLARFFVNVKDPMSGFFLVRKSFVEGREFNAKGYKLLLELLVKVNFPKIVEVPIVFADRTTGKSKASLKEILNLLNNLAGYVLFKLKSVLEP